MPAPVPPPREWQSWKPCKPEIEDLFRHTKIQINCISNDYTTSWNCCPTDPLQILYSTSDNRIPQPPYGQRQVPSRSIQHLRCSAPAQHSSSAFYTAKGTKKTPLIQNPVRSHPQNNWVLQRMFSGLGPIVSSTCTDHVKSNECCHFNLWANQTSKFQTQL